MYSVEEQGHIREKVNGKVMQVLTKPREEEESTPDLNSYRDIEHCTLAAPQSLLGI